MKPFFEWCDGLALSRAIRDSRIVFPLIECLHILALAVLLGTVVLLAIRLLRLGLTTQSTRDVARTLAPLTNASLIAMFATGVPLFLSEALKCYESPPFMAKMIALLLAVVFHYTVTRRTTQSEPSRVRGAVVGLLSPLLWFSVGIAGRAIGFY